MGELGPQVGQLPFGRQLPLRRAFGGVPIRQVGSHWDVAGFDARSECFTGQLRVNGIAGDTAPPGVADVAVGQRAVEVTGRDRVGAVGADNRIGRALST